MRFNPDRPNDCKFCEIASAIGAAVGIGTSLIGGAMASSAAKDAAELQAQSSREAVQLGREGLGFQQEMFDTSRADLAPWRSSGAAALGTMNNLFIPGGQGAVQLQGQLNDLRAQRAVMARQEQRPAAPIQQVGLPRPVQRGGDPNVARVKADQLLLSQNAPGN